MKNEEFLDHKRRAMREGRGATKIRENQAFAEARSATNINDFLTNLEKAKVLSDFDVMSRIEERQRKYGY